MISSKVCSNWRTLVSVLMSQDGEEAMESIDIIIQEVNGLFQDLDPYKTLGPDEADPYILEECAETFDKLFEMLFR